MKTRAINCMIAAIPALCWAGYAFAGFSSGSTGADGAFAPTTDTVVQVPASGILNYTTVNIPAGVTVKFAQSNKAPVVMLASGDVKIAGTIDISGASTPNVAIGSFQFQGGKGGPGGYDGGWGGQPTGTPGGTGYGPGGGGGGIYNSQQCSTYSQGGGGGGFSGSGEASYCIRNGGAYLAGSRTGFGGPGYGSITMLPLVGGSGGGGGGGALYGGGAPGSGGGGGGGALMLVSSGIVELTGTIKANGGNAGFNNSSTTSCPSSADYGGAGGGGAGGAVRILAASFTGAGTINVFGGTRGCANINSWSTGGNGASGRSSVEIVTGGTFNPSALPVLSFTSIGGVAVQPNPTGAGDVVLPDTVTNPVTVNIAATGIPVGTVVKLILNQPYGTNITADSTPLSGTLQSSSATASINIPPGATVLTAYTTYTLTLAMGEALSVYAQGERVEKVRIAAALGGQPQATLITVSGKEYQVPYSVLATIPDFAG